MLYSPCGIACVLHFNINFDYSLESVASLIGLFSISGILLAKGFTKKEIINNDNIIKATRYRIIVSIINLLLYFGIVAYIYHWDKILGKYIEIEPYSLISFISIMLVSALLCFSLFKYVKKNRVFVIFEKVFLCISIFLFFTSALFSLYDVLPLNEFTYQYELMNNDDFCRKLYIDETGSQNTKHVAIDYYIYQDERDLIKKDISIPDTLFGRPVEIIYASYLSSNSDDVNFEIPSSVSFEALKYFNLEHYNNGKAECPGKITLRGENPEYYIKDNVAIRKDGSEIVLLAIDPHTFDDFHISKELQNIYAKLPYGKFFNENSKITIDPENPYFEMLGENAIISKNNSLFALYYESGKTEEMLQTEKDTVNLVLIRPDATINIDDSWLGKNSLECYNFTFFAKLFVNENYTNSDFPIYLNVKEYDVDDNNKYFASYDGCLYNKDNTKLLRTNSNKYDGYKITLHNNIRDFSEQAYEVVTSKIECNELIFDEDSFYINEQYDKYNIKKVLYSKDGTLLACTDDCDKAYILPDTKNISKSLLNSIYYNEDKNYFSFVFSGDNDFFEVKNDFIFNSSKEKLIFGPNERKYLYIPKETKEISDGLLTRFENYYVEVSPDNEFFEMYNGNLFSKGREKLLAVCNNYEEIKATGNIVGTLYEDESGELKTTMEFVSNNDGRDASISGEYVIIAKETNDISKEAVINIVKRKIIVEPNNNYYEVYNDDLYSLGKEKLIAIGNVKNNGFSNVDNEMFYNNEKIKGIRSNVQHGKIIVLAKELKSFDDKVLNILKRPNISRFDFYREFRVEEGNQSFAEYDGNLFDSKLERLILVKGNSYFPGGDDMPIRIPPKTKRIYYNDYDNDEYFRSIYYDFTREEISKDYYYFSRK